MPGGKASRKTLSKGSRAVRTGITSRGGGARESTERCPCPRLPVPPFPTPSPPDVLPSSGTPGVSRVLPGLGLLPRVTNPASELLGQKRWPARQLLGRRGAGCGAADRAGTPLIPGRSAWSCVGSVAWCPQRTEWLGAETHPLVSEMA